MKTMNKDWINKHKFVLAVSAQLLIVALIVAYKLLPSFGGQEVLLKIMPVDPRDWLRGDYVTYRYEISSALNNFPLVDAELYRTGTTVYVHLKKSENYWQADGLSLELPDNGPFIKGQINERNSISFGIEQYFIPEGSGRALPNGTTFARVRLAKNGQPLLKSLLIDGKPWP